MIALTGLLRTIPGDAFWGRFNPSIDLGPHQALFSLSAKDHSLRRVDLSGADDTTVVGDSDCDSLVVTRDFGVRLISPCRFGGDLAGEVETEVRLRLLDNAGEWPRWIAQGRAGRESGAHAPPEQHLAALVAGLFEAELVRFFADQPYRDVSRRLNDPLLVEQVEKQVRSALARWTDERFLGLIAVHLLRVHSEAGERQWQSDADAAQEQARLEREHRLRMLEARQAAELAEVQQAAGVKPVPAPPMVAETAPVRPSAPRVTSADEKQELIQRVLGGLASAQPEAVRVRLFSWAAETSGGVADLIRAAPGGRSVLRVGDEIHIVVDSAVAGYLQVFNIGCSGEVSRIVPEPLQPPERVEANQVYLVSTGAAIARVSSDRPPFSPWFEQGPVNGFPERILAVVTKGGAPLSPGDLHPAWSGSPASAAPVATGFGAPSVEATLSARPKADWAWGIAEAAVTG